MYTPKSFEAYAGYTLVQVPKPKLFQGFASIIRTVAEATSRGQRKGRECRGDHRDKGGVAESRP